MEPEERAAPDVSAAYHLWDDLYAAGLRMALSTAGDSAEEKQQARERFLRGFRRSLEERDRMWVRIAASLGRRDHGG